MKNFDIDYVWNQLKEKQKNICEKYDFAPSDSVWLATTDESHMINLREEILRLYAWTCYQGTIPGVYHDWVPIWYKFISLHEESKIVEKDTVLEPLYKNKWDNKETHEKLKQADILGLTCYVWNPNANDEIAQIFKTYNPKGIVVYGGSQVLRKI